MELVQNRSFTFTTGDSNQSRLCRLKHGFPQRSIFVPLLFNIYTYNLPSTRKCKQSNAVALFQNRKCMEETLSQDMTTLSAYLQICRLKLSHTRTVTAAFYLNNREAKCELKVYNSNKLLSFCPIPTYLEVNLD